MFAFMGLTAEEFALLFFVALAMVVGPTLAAILGLAMMRRLYHVRPGQLGTH
jgi:hypothetical protein